MQQQRRRPPVALSPVNNSNRSTRQSNRSMPSTPSQCFGCSQPMYNQFISNVLDHLWHPECVRCFVCRCLLNEQCYSREGKLYCKDDFIKKYIHRCFACQNLIQSHELIRRIRAGRIYHAECFICSKCKQILKDDDIISLIKSDNTSLNDLDCLCQTCLNPEKSSGETNSDKEKTMNGEILNTMNGKASPPIDNIREEKPPINNSDIPPVVNDKPTTDNHMNESEQSMEVDEHSAITKPSVSPIKERSVSPTITVPTPTKSTGRQSKVRQSTSSNGSKRSPTKSKVTTPVSRQKQTTTNERKGRSPATRSKSSTTTPSVSSTVKTRSSNRRTKKNTRYRKRSFSSGSDEDETEDDEGEDDAEDTDVTEEDHMQDEEQENTHSPVVKNKPSVNSDDKKAETTVPPPSKPPPSTATNPSLLSQAKMSEPLSLLSGLAANPMSISSIMKSDMTPSFMPPNFNPAFPAPQFLPPGFPLQTRLPMPPPPPPPTTSQPAPIPDSNRSSHSDTDSLDRSSSPSQMDVSTNVEPGTPARPVTSPKGSRQATPSTTTQKPSALSSLLEFGTLPPSNLGDIRSSAAPPNPFPFPFVTPGPGVPFSPQAAAGMATFYRPPFGVSPGSIPLDMTQSNSNSSKKKSETTENDEKNTQNTLDDSSLSSSPKKKARKSNSRSKAKTKRNGIDSENGLDEDNTLSPLPASSSSTTTNKKRKKLKTETTENGNTNDNDESKIINGNTNNHSHNLLAQMGLINNSFMPPPLPPSATKNGKTSTPNSQQAQLAAMYNMAPHFAAYNAFPGAFNPAFAAAAYASGYPSPYGFHPAFSAPNPGQPFSFMSPTPSSNMPSLNNIPPSTTTTTNDDKSSSSLVIPETRPVKSKNKSNNGGEKKKAATPRTNKKKFVSLTSTDSSIPTEIESSMAAIPSNEITPQVATTPNSTSTPTRQQMSGTESDDFDEQQQQQYSQATNGKSGYESDGSIGDGDHSLNTIPSTSSTAPEKKGARTTIKPQQLEILCKAYDTCSKPNKTQREQLVADTGLSLRVIQVWFQNRRSKERKGKPSKEKDDDDLGEDSQPSPPPTTSESIPVVPEM